MIGYAANDPERTPDGRSGCSLDDTRRMQPEGGATTNFDGNSSSLLDCKYVPLAGNALEGLAASVAETQPRARHQVLHGARHQYLAGARKRRDTRTENGQTIAAMGDYGNGSMSPVGALRRVGPPNCCSASARHTLLSLFGELSF
jgi:hypothetical protein